jgi:ABC-2 type transport system permease protein
MTLAIDSAIVLRRQLRPMSRDPFTLLFGMLQPLVFLILYGPLLVATGATGE